MKTNFKHRACVLALIGVSFFSISANAAAEQFIVRIPAKVQMPSAAPQEPQPQEPDPQEPAAQDPIVVNLAAFGLPEAKVGVSYFYDFTSLLSISGGSGSYSINDVQWTLGSGATIPSGLALNASGVLSGTPTSAGEFSFQVHASYQDSSGSQGYALKSTSAVSPSKWDIAYSTSTQSTDGGRTARVFNVSSIPAPDPLPSTGKFYWEVTPVGLSNFAMIGVGTRPVGAHNYATSCQAYEANSNPYIGGQVSVVKYGNALSTRTFGLAFDADAKKLDVYRGNTKLFTCTFTTDAPLYAIAGTGSSESTVRADFQPHEMTYAPPEGYTAGIPLGAQQ